MADSVTRLCLAVVLSAVTILSRDLAFATAHETRPETVDLHVEEKRACSESREKRSADRPDLYLLPSALEVRFRTGDEDVRLNLQKNSDLEARPPIFVMRDGLPLRADITQAKPNVGFYQDPDNGASFSVRLRHSGSGYLLSGVYFSGNDQYSLTPNFNYRQTGTGQGDHDVMKMASDVSLQNDFLDLLPAGSAEASDVTKDSPHDYNDVTNEDAYQTTVHDVLDSSQAAGNDVTRRVRRRRQTPRGTFTVELLMVIDYGVYEKWLSRMQGSTEEARKQAAIGNITEYYSFVLNGVDLRYAGINANFSIDISFAGILVFDDPTDTYWSGGRLPVGSPRDLVEASEALEAFRAWALKRGASLPPSDHVMLFTGEHSVINTFLSPPSATNITNLQRPLLSRFNLTYGGSVSNAGLAYLGSACNTDYYFSIVEEYLDFRTVAVAAHELAHSLGARHDMDGNTCLTFDRYIMTSRFRFPTARTAQNPWKFSTCSVQYFSDFIDDLFRNDTNCLVTKDAVTSSVEIQPFLVSLPGQVYPNDQFCQLSEGEGSYICRDKHTEGYGTTCYAGLQCYRPEFEDCDLKLPPDGLACGDKKWCENGTCVFSPQALPAVDDLCPFGDNPVLLTASSNCSERVRMSRADCYEQGFRAQCCESCAAVRRDDLPGCEFGDTVNTCNRLLCAAYNSTHVRQNCCQTCANGLLGQANFTPSAGTPVATRLSATTAGIDTELPTVSVGKDAGADLSQTQTVSSSVSFQTYEVTLSPSLPPDQPPEIHMAPTPSLLPPSDQPTEIYKAVTSPLLPPDQLTEIHKAFTPPFLPPYQPPETYKGFTRLLPPPEQRPEIQKEFSPPSLPPEQRPEIRKEFTPPLHTPDQRPEIHKEFTPPLHTPDQRPEIHKEFTPPLPNPDQGPEIQKEFTPPLHTPDQRPEIHKEFTPPLPTADQGPEIHKEFTPPLQNPDQPTISHGGEKYLPVSTDHPPVIHRVETFPISSAPSLTQVEDTSPLPTFTGIYFNEEMSTVGSTSDHDGTSVSAETTMATRNTSDQEHSLDHSLAVSRTTTFDPVPAATSPGFTGNPENVTSPDKAFAHVTPTVIRKTTQDGLEISRDTTINPDPITSFGLTSTAVRTSTQRLTSLSDTNTGEPEVAGNLAKVTASGFTLSSPAVVSLPGTQSLPGLTSLPGSQSVPRLTSHPDSQTVPSSSLGPAVTSALGTLSVPNLTSASRWAWLPSVTSALSSTSVPNAASLPGVTSSPSNMSQPVIPTSTSTYTTIRNNVVNTDPLVTPSSTATKDRSPLARTSTARPAVTSQGSRGRGEKQEGGQDRENRGREGERQKTEGGPGRLAEHKHGGGLPPFSKLGPQPGVGAGQKGRSNDKQREREGSVSMETEEEEEARGERGGGRAGDISSSEEQGLQAQKVRDAGTDKTGSDVTNEQRLSGLINLLLLLQNLKSANLQLVTSELSALGGDFGGDGTVHLLSPSVATGVKGTNRRSHVQDEEQSTSAVSFQRASLPHSSIATGDDTQAQRGRGKTSNLPDPSIGQRAGRRQVWAGPRHRYAEAGGSSRRRRRRRSSRSLKSFANAVTTFDRHPLMQALRAVTSEQGLEYVAISARGRLVTPNPKRRRRDVGSSEASSPDSQQTEANDQVLGTRWQQFPQRLPQQPSIESHLSDPGDEAATDFLYHFDDDEEDHDSADAADVLSPGQTAFSREDGSNDRHDEDAAALSQGLGGADSAELEAGREGRLESDVSGATSGEDDSDVSDENDTDDHAWYHQPDPNDEVTTDLGPSDVYHHKTSDVVLGPLLDQTSLSGEEVFQKVVTEDERTVLRPGDVAGDDSGKDDDSDASKSTTVDEDNTDEGNNSEADDNHKDGMDGDSKDVNNEFDGATDQKIGQIYVTANGEENNNSYITDDKDDEVSDGDDDPENCTGAKTMEPVTDSTSVASGQTDRSRDKGEAYGTVEPVDHDSFFRDAVSAPGRDSLEDSPLDSVADDQPAEFQAASVQVTSGDDPTEGPVSHDSTGLPSDGRAGGSDPPEKDLSRAGPTSGRSPDIFTDDGDTFRDMVSSGDVMGMDDDEQKGQQDAGNYGSVKNNVDNNFQRWTPDLSTLQISDRADNSTGISDGIIPSDDIITRSEDVVARQERTESEQQVTSGGGTTPDVETTTKSSDTDSNRSRRPTLAARPLNDARTADNGVGGKMIYRGDDRRTDGQTHNGSGAERMTLTGGRESSVIKTSPDGVDSYKVSTNGEVMSERLEDLQGRPRRKLLSGNTSLPHRSSLPRRPQSVTSNTGRQSASKLPPRTTRLAYSLPRGQPVMPEVTSGSFMTSEVTRKYATSTAEGSDVAVVLTPSQNSVTRTSRATFNPGNISGGKTESSH